MSSGSDDGGESDGEESDSSEDIGTRLDKITLAKQQNPHVEEDLREEEEDGDEEEVAAPGEDMARGQPEESVEAAAPATAASAAAELSKLKVAQLKEKCRELGLKVGGKKEELIQRLSGRLLQPCFSPRVLLFGTPTSTGSSKLPSAEHTPKRRYNCGSRTVMRIIELR
ncbi:expressed unknown protein [Seminavis robusta]|uniref:SAP domain-containing protein n=1 Tax=Seminavis robusta TaxID=568900 RepID=A0A9N8HFW5_9STRA|nr:expressed unknown protein [Seminavis robusta]|eukprot:Sro368_g128080.1 n/a (169) ;mRNA; f:71021-71527